MRQPSSTPIFIVTPQSRRLIINREIGMASKLFSPFRLRDLELENRIVTSPMMQFSANENSEATDWHIIHYGTMAISGAGLVITEATSVTPQAAYARSGLGLWTDGQ